jgi:Flp pilus assembly protein TadG
MRTQRDLTKKEKGSTIVETTLVLLVFIIVMVGIADFATFLHLHQAIAERTRSVARTAVIDDLNATAISNLIAYGVATVSEDSKLQGYFGLSPSNIGVQILDRGQTSQRIVVTVTNLSFPLISPLLTQRGRNMPIRIAVPLETP